MASETMGAAPVERIRLSPGRHADPGQGACVVELSSLVALEPFSDRPRCVCPVVAAFLRGWNDRAAYSDRQRLRPYALRIVGSRAADSVTRERRDLCLEWVGANLRGGWIRRTLVRASMRLRIAVFCGPAYAARLDEGAGEYAARVLFGRRDVEGAFVLLDAMLALGTGAQRSHNGRHNGNGHVPHVFNGNGVAVNGNGAHHGNGNGAEPVSAAVSGARPRVD